MFESGFARSSSRVWKILPVGLVLFGVVVWIVVSLGQSSQSLNLPLDGILRAGHPDFEMYFPSVHLESRSIQMAKNFAGNRMVIFSGSLDNGGDRSLDVIEVKLTLFNYDQPVFEKLATPIRPGAKTPPIKSLEQRNFQVYLEDLPPNWLASRAEMELSGFRFQER